MALTPEQIRLRDAQRREDAIPPASDVPYTPVPDTYPRLSTDPYDAGKAIDSYTGEPLEIPPGLGIESVQALGAIGSTDGSSAAVDTAAMLAAVATGNSVYFPPLPAGQRYWLRDATMKLIADGQSLIGLARVTGIWSDRTWRPVVDTDGHSDNFIAAGIEFVQAFARAATITANSGSGLFTASADLGLIAGSKVAVAGLTGGAGLVQAQTYYVLASGLTPTTCKLSATPGGAPVTFTTNVTAGRMLKRRESWSYGGGDPRDDDSTISRAAAVMAIGGHRFRAFCSFDGVYAAIRRRPANRYAGARCKDDVIHVPLRNHQFGVLMMGTENQDVFTDGDDVVYSDTAPGHDVYCAGNGALPPGVTIPTKTISGATTDTGVFATTTAHGMIVGQLAGITAITGPSNIIAPQDVYILTVPSSTTFTCSLTPGGAPLIPDVAVTAGQVATAPDLDSDGFSDLPPGVADLTIRGGRIRGIARGNTGSTAHKIRNCRGTTVESVVTASSRAVELSYCADMNPRCEVREMAQTLGFETGLPASSSVLSAVQANYCARVTVELVGTIDGEQISGLTTRNQCASVDLAPSSDIDITYTPGSASTRTAIKTVDSAGGTFGGRIRVNGANKPAWAATRSQNCRLLKPRIDVSDPTFTGPFATLDAGSAGNTVLIDQALLNVTARRTGLVTDLGTNNHYELLAEDLPDFFDFTRGSDLATVPRALATVDTNIAITAGTQRGMLALARSDRPQTQVTFKTGTTAPSAVTDLRFVVLDADTDQPVAETANVSGTVTLASTTYTVPLTATFTPRRGKRYYLNVAYVGTGFRLAGAAAVLDSAAFSGEKNLAASASYAGGVGVAATTHPTTIVAPFIALKE